MVHATGCRRRSRRRGRLRVGPPARSSGLVAALDEHDVGVGGAAPQLLQRRVLLRLPPARGRRRRPGTRSRRSGRRASRPRASPARRRGRGSARRGWRRSSVLRRRYSASASRSRASVTFGDHVGGHPAIQARRPAPASCRGARDVPGVQVPRLALVSPRGPARGRTGRGSRRRAELVAVHVGVGDAGAQRAHELVELAGRDALGRPRRRTCRRRSACRSRSRSPRRGAPGTAACRPGPLPRLLQRKTTMPPLTSFCPKWMCDCVHRALEVAVVQPKCSDLVPSRLTSASTSAVCRSSRRTGTSS